MEPTRQALLELLRTHSVIVGDFVLSSGKRSSYYVDARMTTMSAEGLEVIGALGLREIRSAGWSATSVGGLTLGADPVAYAIAMMSVRQPPMINAFTVRKESKSHGTGKRIEGRIRPGESVVVVEDVITTGGSAMTAIEAITSAGSTVIGVLGVVDREEGGRARIEQKGFPVRCLGTLTDLGMAADNPGSRAGK